MRGLYTLLVYLLLPLVVLRLFWRSLRAPAYRQRWLERFGSLPLALQQDSIWLHAVSVGEVQAAQPLIRELLLRYPQMPLVVTTTTPTGARRVDELFGGEVHHLYAPLDVPLVVRRFFRALRPRILILMETEIWPNLLHECQRRGVPSLLANARLSARSARRYQRLAGLTRQTLQRIDLIAAQGERDAERFIGLGAISERLLVSGSVKFDLRLPASLREQVDVLRREWGQERPVWIAASTHEGEEGPILEAHAQVRERLPNALLVLVPRHPERFERVAELVSVSRMAMVRRSQQRPCSGSTAVFLGDSMGELPLFLGAADLAFIGGSLVPVGGHNILEAAAQGVPVVFGPHVFNFAEISELFLAQGAARQVQDVAGLVALLLSWLGDASQRSVVGERGRELVEANRGALQRLLQQVDQLLAGGRR